MITHTIERELAVLSESGDNRKLLTVTAWNHNPGKLDLRTWRTDEAGEEKPNKGLTLSDAEARILLEALTEYFK